MENDILNAINEMILDEKGRHLNMQDMFMDSQLDSLGIMLMLTTLDNEYPILKNVPEEVDIVDYLDIQNLTVRSLVNKCKLSITST